MTVSRRHFYRGEWIDDSQMLLIDWERVANGSTGWDGWEECYLAGIRVAKGTNYGK